MRHSSGVSLTGENATQLRRLVAARGTATAATMLGASPTLLDKLADGGTARADAVARLVNALMDMETT